MFYSFANRRRAKDTIMLILDKFGADGMTVFVQDEMVIIDPAQIVPFDERDVVFHFAEQMDDNKYEMDLGNITEFYRGAGINKFRV